MPYWYPTRLSEQYIPGLSELRKKQYENTEFMEEAYIRWQWQQNPAGAAISWIALDKRENALGEYWMIPIKIKAGSRIYTASLGANALVRPDYRRLHLFTTLGAKCAEDCEERGVKFTFYVPNQISLRGIISKYGCKDLGAIPLLLYILDYNKLSENQCHNKTLQKILKFFTGKLHPGEKSSTGYIDNNNIININKIQCFEENYDCFWNKVQGNYFCSVIRNSGYMNWRYIAAPKRSYEVLFGSNENKILGYLISRTANFRGYKVGFIMDFLTERSELGRLAGKSLIHKVVNKYRDEQVHLLCCLMLSHAEEYALLSKYGFFKCPELFKPHPLHLAAQIHDSNVVEGHISRLKSWFWTLGDFDII